MPIDREKLREAILNNPLKDIDPDDVDYTEAIKYLESTPDPDPDRYKPSKELMDTEFGI